MRYSLPKLPAVVVVIAGVLVMAGGTFAESLKMSVVIPAAVGMINDDKQANDPAGVKVRKSWIVQKQQAVRNKRPVTIRSTVGR